MERREDEENLSCHVCRKALNMSFVKSLQSKQVFMMLAILEEKNKYPMEQQSGTAHLKSWKERTLDSGVPSTVCLECAFVMRSPLVAGASELMLRNIDCHLQTGDGHGWSPC